MRDPDAPTHKALGPKVLDGGLATSLRARGVPQHTPVSEWLDERPEAIETAQRGFVDAGATGLLTATFRCLPHLDPQWDRHVAVAVEIATSATRGRAWMWGSIGPGGRRGESWADASRATRAEWEASWRQCAARLGPSVHGLVLETFLDADECLAALRAVKEVRPDQAVATSLVPTENGRLHSGEPVRHALETLRLAGADIMGFNCGTSPEAVVRAIRSCRGVGPLWAKPAGGRNVRAALLSIADDCDWIGGCCGVSYKDIAVLARGLAETHG
ncbi:MAG: methionine synthase I (cobalamin-dependent) [Myxococcota bacterium]|jgi:methionine synthase I (cobalamin-dependent)